MPSALNPRKRSAVRAAVGAALEPYVGDMTGYDGDLDPFFVDRLSLQCALSLELDEREAQVTALYCPRMTAAQIKALTGAEQPAESRDRRLTQAEVAGVLHWSVETIYLAWRSACAKIEPHVNALKVYGFAIDEGL